jgi:hypothetical protein
LRRVGWIDRHIGASGLKDAQDAHDHLDGAFGEHRHDTVRTHTPASQGCGKGVGSGIQLTVAYRNLAANDSGFVGGGYDLIFKECLDAFLRG